MFLIRNELPTRQVLGLILLPVAFRAGTPQSTQGLAEPLKWKDKVNRVTPWNWTNSFFFFFFLMALQGFWDLSCQLEIEPRPSAVRLWGPNLQTTREVPEQLLKSFQCGSEVAAMSLAGPLLFRHWENSGCIKSELPRMFSCPLEFRGSMGLGLYKMK